MPLHEAISNSLHAVHDRFGDKHSAERGSIKIEIIRDPRADGDPPIIGFVVTDNGVGLNKDNFHSFRTPFSQHKLKRGGKGVGRLGWLKVFKAINVKSRFKDGSKLQAMEFDFVLRDRNQIDLKDTPKDVKGDTGTTVKLVDFIEPFGSRCPTETDDVVQRIIGHFLPIFAGDQSPKVTVEDGVIIDVREEFKTKIAESQEALIDVEIEGQKHPIIVRHMKCLKGIRPRSSNYNWMWFLRQR